MHSRTILVLMGVLLFGLSSCCSLFDLPRCSTPKPLFSKYVVGDVHSLPTGNSPGVIKVGNNHEFSRIVFFKSSDIQQGPIVRDGMVFFKLYGDKNGLAYAREIIVDPPGLQAVYAGEVTAGLGYHQLFAHIHRDPMDDNEDNIPIHIRAHLVKYDSRAIRGNPWEFNLPGSSENLELNGHPEGWEAFEFAENVDVYITYDLSSETLLDIDTEHVH